jgi:ATP-binding cassette subfamily C protein LapB
MTEGEKRPVERQWQVADDSSNYDDPLVDCLEILSKIHDRPTSRTVLRAGLPLVDNRLTVELVARAADRAGLATRVRRSPLDKLRAAQLPAILLLEERQACIAMEVDQERQSMVVVWPESGGEEAVSLADLALHYTGHAIFVKPKYRLEEAALDHGLDGNKNWFWGTIFSSWRIYRDVLVASLLINIFGLATPIFIINVYDRIVPNAAFETLWVLASGVAIIYLFELLLRGLRGYFIDSSGKKANVILSSMLFEKVLSLRMEARPKSVGAFAKQLQQFNSIREFITSISITALIDLPFSLLALAVIWFIAPPLVWIHVVCILLIWGYALLIQIPLKKAVRNAYLADAEKNAVLVEGLNGLETIKILGAESKVQRAWEEAVCFIADWGARSRFLSTSVSHTANFLQNVAIILVIIGSVYLISRGEMSGGGLFACILLTRRVMSPMTQVVGLTTRFHQAKNSLQTLNAIMALPSERPAEKVFLHRTSFQGEIALQNLSFTYPGSSGEILRNINLQIRPGERVGIIGPIGSGKSTLGKLLLGLYQPTNGMVAMDGTDIRQIDPADLRRFIGYVPQEVVLFRGTVRDNIILGAHDIDDATVLRVAEIAGINAFVNRHPLGFDMPVEERGGNLSGGQRQCIAIARALLLDPPVLVMDEPTSSMDNRSETLLRQNLADVLQGKTTIIITHRTSLLEVVDRLIVLNREAVVADGTTQRILEALKNGQLTL